MIFLNEDSKARMAIIGDEIAFYLQKYNTEDVERLIDVDMTMRRLFKRLTTDDVYDTVDYLIVSIGSKGYYSEIMDVSLLCNLIKEVFPKSEYYVIEGFLPNKDYPFLSEEDLKEIEESRNIFYDEFQKNDFYVIGTGSLMSEEPLDFTNTKISDILDFISELRYQDVISDKKSFQTKKTYNKDIKGDDIEDFSSIYDFLERFEEIVDSGNVYENKGSSKYSADVHQIEIALSFLMPEFDDYVKYEGIFDDETEDMIMTFQKDKNLPVTGIADQETLEEIFYSLKIKGFDDEDLGKYLGEKDIEISKKQIYTRGRVDYSKAGLSSEQASNVQLMIDYMIEKGILNPYTQIGILSTCGKESGFIPQNEICYDKTDNTRIREIFGDCRTKHLNDAELTTLKKDCEGFFEAMYGLPAKPCFNWDTGNNSPGDGYKYRGRGFNGLTFKSLYQKYGDLVGESLVSDPERMNDVDVAAKVAVEFFTKGKGAPEFEDKESATEHFVNVNAGGFTSWMETHDSAQAWARKFDVLP